MKFLKSSLVVMLTVVTLLSSKPSQAAVGAAFSASAVVITGLVVAGGGAFVSIDTLGDRSNYRGLITVFIGLPLLALGLIVLDEEQVVSFAPLSPAQTKELGLSQHEVRIYNSEIDQANALLAHVASELTEAGVESSEESAAVWTDLKDSVSPETFSVMTKLAANIQK